MISLAAGACAPLHDSYSWIPSYRYRYALLWRRLPEIARKMRVKRPGVRVREARLRPGGSGLARESSVASRAGNVCSPLLPLIASRCTPREEARDGAFWMKRLFCSRLLTLRLVSRGARDSDGEIPKAHNRLSGNGPGRTNNDEHRRASERCLVYFVLLRGTPDPGGRLRRTNGLLWLDILALSAACVGVRASNCF
jgi:hypothetical protein